MIGSLSVIIEDEDFHSPGVANPSTNNSPTKSIKTKSPVKLSPNKVNRRTSVQTYFLKTLGPFR